jgi:phosphatidylserine/phosphatidylglycerophosphate/cardiolipin synthase-like enzyme
VLVQAYSFTSAPIAKALLDAHKRGVQVQVILDKSQRTEKYSSADFLANQGVLTMIDATHAIAHNKVIVIDGETVLTGSFNFTKAAQEKNAENLLIIRDPPSRRSMRRTGTPIASIVSYMWAAGSGNRQGCPLHAPSGYWFMCRSRMT